MIYTSGTTGRPKGVRRQPPAGPERAELMAGIRARVFGVRPRGRILMTGPAYHSAPNLFAMAAMLNDNLIVLQPRFDAEQCLALIERYRITGVHLVPTMFVRLLKLPDAVRAKYDLSSLEHVVHGAARCPADVKQAIIDWLGPIVHEYYGGTESGPVVACTSEEFLAHPGTVGRAVETGVIKILDAQGKELPPGESGEIYMWLDAYPDFTYQGDDDKRRRIELDGLITLGDVGHMDADGYLYISDRLKDMVISGGVNIYPAEIEGVLISMPGVHDCAVFGIPDEEFGEALAAAIEPEPGAALTAEAVQAWLAERQAGYKTPKLVTFHEALPREDTGKIFKRRLREPYWRDTGRNI
jgi:long-chain acyl-CoA synthetase